MKKLIQLVSLFCTAGTLLAQGYDAPVRNLSDEEILLVQAYRKNPEPFRRVLYGPEAGLPPGRDHRDAPTHPRAMGPRDVIDVKIEGGSVAFYGKSYAFDPVSFRIVRGEDIELVFRRQKSSSETRVVVSYRSDGLHFDVPEARVGTSGPEHGLLVLAEDERWNRGDPIATTDKLNARRSLSKADHLTFYIRYASSRP